MGRGRTQRNQGWAVKKVVRKLGGVGSGHKQMWVSRYWGGRVDAQEPSGSGSGCGKLFGCASTSSHVAMCVPPSGQLPAALSAASSCMARNFQPPPDRREASGLAVRGGGGKDEGTAKRVVHASINGRSPTHESSKVGKEEGTAKRFVHTSSTTSSTAPMNTWDA
eukprot:365672-Chlamydomonas_euryale.AAC.9